jgi:hypothetical protein
MLAMSRLLLLTLCAALATSDTSSASSGAGAGPVTGDFFLEATVPLGNASVDVAFDCAAPRCLPGTARVWWHITADGAALMRDRADGNGTATLQVRRFSMPRGPKMRLELLRRGTFFLLYVGAAATGAGGAALPPLHLTSQPVTYVERPSSDVICSIKGQHVHLVDPEPQAPSIFVAVVGGRTVCSTTITPYRWEAAPLPDAPVLTHCPTCGTGCDPAANKTAACWAFNQIIPGAILQLNNGSFVVYVAGSNWDGNDGGGKQYMGAATGPALDKLTLHPEYLL